MFFSSKIYALFYQKVEDKKLKLCYSVSMVLKVVDLLFWVYLIMLMARILGSWIPELMGTRFMLFISFYTDPYLNLFRRFIPPLGMIDISPIIAFLFLGLIETVVKALVMALLRW
jgi:YggT family protein